MKGQISLEFLVAVLVMVSLLMLLISNQNHQSQELMEITQDVKEKMQADVVGAYCNLFYFNRYNIELGLALNMDKKIEKKVECFGAPVQWIDGRPLKIDKGIKRW